MLNRYLLLVVSIFCLFFASQAAFAESSVQVTSDNFTLSGKIDGAEAVEIISELERFRSALLEVHDLPADNELVIMGHRRTIAENSSRVLVGTGGLIQGISVKTGWVTSGPR